MASASVEEIEPQINDSKRDNYPTKANQGKGNKIIIKKKDSKMETKKR